MELKWLAALLLLLLSLASGVQVIAGEMQNAKIKKPIDWICITTAGGKRVDRTVTVDLFCGQLKNAMGL